MDSSNKILEEARARALSRSSILQSLQQSFGKQPSAASKPAASRPAAPAVASKHPAKHSGQPSNKRKADPASDALAQVPAKKSKQAGLAPAASAPALALSLPKAEPVGSGDEDRSSRTSLPSSHPSTATTPATVATPSSSYKQLVYGSVETLLRLIGDNSDKSREFYRENLQSKAIVTENTKRQQSANKALSRIQRRERQQQRMSKRQLKKLNSGDYRAGASGGYDLKIMSRVHSLWWEYVRILVRSSKGDSQLQARLEELELVGARVVIHQSTKPVLVGVSGLIISQSAKTFHLLHDRYRPPREKPCDGKDKAEAKPQTKDRPSSGASHKSRITAHYLATHQVIKVPRSEVTLAIHLPQASMDRGAAGSGERDGAEPDEKDEEDAGNDSEKEAEKNDQSDSTSHSVQESEEMDVDADGDQSQADWLQHIARRESHGKVMLLHGLHFAPFSRRVK